MLPLHSSGICACVYHLFYNSPAVGYIVLVRPRIRLTMRRWPRTLPHLTATRLAPSPRRYVCMNARHAAASVLHVFRQHNARLRRVARGDLQWVVTATGVGADRRRTADFAALAGVCAFWGCLEPPIEPRERVAHHLRMDGGGLLFDQVR